MKTPDQGNMFSTSPQATQPVVAPEVVPVEGNTNQYETIMASIVNDAGTQKYSDVSVALNSIAPAQEHIKTLEAKMVELQADLDKRQTTEELIKDMQAKPTEIPSVAPAAFDPSQITDLVNSTINANTAAAAATTNQQSVIKALSDKFGDVTKAEEAYVAKAGEMGIDTKTLDSLAGKSPAAVLAWFPKIAAAPSISTSNLSVAAVTASLLPDGTPKPTSVMGASSTADVVDNWRLAGKIIEQS